MNWANCQDRKPQATKKGNSANTRNGSKMHFLRSLFLDSLKRDNFRTSDYEVGLEIDAKGTRIEKIQPIPENSLKVIREPDFKAASMTRVPKDKPAMPMGGGGMGGMGGMDF